MVMDLHACEATVPHEGGGEEGREGLTWIGVRLLSPRFSVSRRRETCCIHFSRTQS